MIKIIYYTDQVYLHGGIERVLANKINYLLSDGGFEVHLVTSEQKGEPFCYEMDDRLIHHDLGINYDRKRSYYHPKNFIKAPKHYVTLRNKIKELKADIIIVCNFSFDYYFITFLFIKIKKIKEFHSSRYYENIKRKETSSLLKKAFYKFNDVIESKYDYLAILNKSEKQYYKSSNTVIIPNGITNYPANKSNLTKKKAISAGRINQVKQFDKLITAWSYVSKVNPDWELNIYGMGEKAYMEALQKKINEYDLRDIVYLRGSTSVLEEKMLDASIFVMSSKTECFPMVLLEAMSCGLPVISFDCPHGPSHIITNNIDGILVEQDNVHQLADAIISIINNEVELKTKARMARENIKRFQQKTIMKQWIKIFNQAIK